MKLSLYSILNTVRDLPISDRQPLIQFKIPSFHEYNCLITYSYSLSQLKMICIHYSIHKNGNKNDLYKRIYYYLYFSFMIIKIQKYWRGHIQRYCNRLRGPAFHNFQLCVNQTDFLTFEPLSDISRHHFYSFKENNVIYGGSIISFYEWIKKSNINPYTRVEFNNSILENIYILIVLSKILKLNIDIIPEQVLLTYSSNIVNLCSNIDKYGYTTNPSWILSLSRTDIILFLRELYNIWNYKIPIPHFVKKNICPPRGDLFHYIDLDNIIYDTMNTIKKYVIFILNKLINTGSNEDFRCLGSTYILMALTTINPNVATIYPWLYDSFI